MKGIEEPGLLERVKIHFPELVSGRDPLDVIHLARSLRMCGYEGAYWMTGPEENKFAELNRQAPELFEATSGDEAQVWFYPYRAQGDVPTCRRLALEAKERRTGCLFLSWGDADPPIDLPHGKVYRHSMDSNLQLSCEAAMPGFTMDVLEEMGRPLQPRPWRDTPTVGFCGYVSTPFMRSAYRVMGRQHKALGLELRARLLKQLHQSGIQTRFITRRSYWAGTVSRFHRDPAGQFGPRKEFLNNVIDSDYTLCVRGAGNFSYRFYEALSAGRIPLFVNTRCVLPFPDQIAWRNHCVWVEEDEIDRIDQILLRFHREIGPQRFQQMQEANRKIWEEYLAPLPFYRRIIQAAVNTGGSVLI
jgi:Exostosin family